MLWLEADAWNTPPGSSWERSSEPSPSLPWCLLLVEAGFFLLRGLIIVRAQVPRFEHTPGYQFGLHISASPVSVVQFFSGPGPNPAPCSPAVPF